MRKIVSLFLLIASLFSFKTKVEANRFNRVVIFGDSLSDTGNVYKLTNGVWPIVPPYYQGRFCNGPIWIDRLNIREKLNHAYGGATTDNNLSRGKTNVKTITPPDVREQIKTYSANTDTETIASKRTLHTLWAGGNDFLYNRNLFIPTFVNSLMNLVRNLLAIGAKNLLVFNQVPFQATPYVHKYHQNIIVTALTNLINSDIRANLNLIQKQYPEASIHMFDIYALMIKIVANQSTITFANTVDKCWAEFNITSVVQFCEDPTEYVYLDHFHLTDSVHELIADAIRPFLSSRFKENSPGCYIHSF